jgi:hypothetical protein
MRLHRYASFATAFAAIAGAATPLQEDLTGLANARSDQLDAEALAVGYWSEGEDGTFDVLEQMFREIPLGRGADDSGRGWLTRWMALGGEGEVFTEVRFPYATQGVKSLK